MANVSFIIAFFAGVISFVSPCVLPLIPSYLSYITGLTLKDLLEEDRSRVRKLVIINSLLFILGFSLVFVFLGATASVLGQILYRYRDVIRIAGGFFITIMGLYILGLFKLRFLDVERRLHLKVRPTSYFGSIIAGIVFAAAWTPCVGPVLASILTLAGVSQTLGSGVFLLVAYSLGLGIPFFLSSLALDAFLIYSKKVKPYLGVITFINGFFLLIVGILILTGYFQSVIAYLVD